MGTLARRILSSDAKIGAVVDCRRWGENGLHRAWKSVGERLLRELQLEASRRTAERRDLLLAQRGQGHHRGLAAPLQHDPPALIARLPAAVT